MRIKLTFSYDGSKFFGFQRQKLKRSVQKEIEDALKCIYKQDTFIKASGRTDAGVHANNQVAHYDTDLKIKNIVSKLNILLNPDIVIKNAIVVKDDFHARMSVKKKEYIYKINLGSYKSCLNNYYYQPRYKIDINYMKEASKLFIGTHDFRNFTAGERDDYSTTIFSIKFVKYFDKFEIRFVGTGFYRYMVRNLVGALLEVGKCKIYPDVIKRMLENPEKCQSLPTAPPEGLYLNKIWY